VNIIETALPGVLIIEPDVFPDSRGFFLEGFNAARYARYGIPGEGHVFVQENATRSHHGVLRGLHFQINHPQGKLFSVSAGRVFDVIADVNPDSQNFLQWISMELSDDNHRQVWVPPGYAHGICVLSETADVHYRCTDYFDAQDSGGVAWDDAQLAIGWPVVEPLLSDRDRALTSIASTRRWRLPQ